MEVESRFDEDRVDELDCVEDREFPTKKESTYLYLLEVTALEMPESVAQDHDELVVVCDPTVSDRGLLLSLVGQQERIGKTLRHFEAVGTVPDLHKPGEYEGGERTLDTLTHRQSRSSGRPTTCRGRPRSRRSHRRCVSTGRPSRNTSSGPNGTC
ncbi:MAG: hypothetical protein V5A55_06475 [Halovenus sp.]